MRLNTMVEGFHLKMRSNIKKVAVGKRSHLRSETTSAGVACDQIAGSCDSRGTAWHWTLETVVARSNTALRMKLVKVAVFVRARILYTHAYTRSAERIGLLARDVSPMRICVAKSGLLIGLIARVYFSILLRWFTAFRAIKCLA